LSQGIPLEKYRAKQATKNTPSIVGDIQPTIVPRIATTIKDNMKMRKVFWERSGFMKRSPTITTAGIRKRTAGFQRIVEPGNLNGADTKRSTTIKTIAKDVKETNLYSFISFSPFACVSRDF
jgi:hypothetical protein